MNHKSVFAGVLYPMNFVNHLEWIARQQNTSNINSQARISVVATEDSTVLEWEREYLQETFKQYGGLGGFLTSLLGRELAENTQLLAGGAEHVISSEFVHHVYCGCDYGRLRKDSEQELLLLAHEKHPEFLWQKARLGTMSSNKSFRTLKLSPEQWLIRDAVGDGPWVDMTFHHLLDGIALLYERVSKSKKTAQSEFEKQLALRFLRLTIGGVTVAEKLDSLRAGALHVDYSKAATETEGEQHDFGAQPWVQVFAVIACQEIPADYEASRETGSEKGFPALDKCRQLVRARNKAPSHPTGSNNNPAPTAVFGDKQVGEPEPVQQMTAADPSLPWFRPNDAPAPASSESGTAQGSGTGIEMGQIGADGERATSKNSVDNGPGPNLLEYVREVHRVRLKLQEEIEDKKTDEPNFEKRLMSHAHESTELEMYIKHLYQVYLDEHDKYDMLASKRLHNLVVAEQNVMRQDGMRVLNARLLGVEPAMLARSPPNTEGAMPIYNKFFEPLFDYLQTNLPGLDNRELIELYHWGKWRVMFKPGTVFLRQGEFPHFIGIVLDGMLMSFTEDQFTSSRSLTHVIRKNHLVGSEDFQVTVGNSKTRRTARRTISVPTREQVESAPPGMVKRKEIEAQFGNLEEKKWWQLERENLDKLGLDIDSDMLEHWQKAQLLHKKASQNVQDLEEREENMWFDQRAELSRPTVMFVWEIQDLQRLMRADPRVNQAISTLLGCELGEMRTQAAPGSLGSFFCGMRTEAATDAPSGSWLCGRQADYESIETVGVSDLPGPNDAV
eukprot:TRINITY_DN1098_c0_g1_i8.p1 TRINITY_DN1098_c0_g1~~TRINITY_DN1098_c0_g1_i8.p1  ORF type:complete len:785 (-),score=189.21 TRINITY_DN1098_c0_g1_i8:598-2952(-)